MQVHYEQALRRKTKYEEDPPLAPDDVVITVNTAHCVTLQDGLRRLMQKKMDKQRNLE